MNINCLYKPVKETKEFQTVLFLKELLVRLLLFPSVTLIRPDLDGFSLLTFWVYRISPWGMGNSLLLFCAYFKKTFLISFLCVLAIIQDWERIRNSLWQIEKRNPWTSKSISLFITEKHNVAMVDWKTITTTFSSSSHHSWSLFPHPWNLGWPNDLFCKRGL